MKKRILFSAAYSVIEPLGLLHLGGMARDMGWERMYSLIPDHDYTEFFERVKDFKPSVVGINIYTGNHVQAFEAIRRLKKDNPNIITVVGGPHPTYFPEESAMNADYAVMSEGFHALSKILNNKASPGILHMESIEEFPHPDREEYYKQYPEHGHSHIKSFITMTGCPFKCTYCYNSSEIEDIAAPESVLEKIRNSSASMQAKFNRYSSRLFPHNIRTVESVIREAQEIAERWPTNVLYCQDDIHGFDINNWMPEMVKRWNKEVGIPYHAQLRWEMTAQSAGEKRLDMLKEAGCFGLTLAIEAADPTIRKEVLDRAMKEEIIYVGMKRAVDLGFKIRTEQITGLPYGATSKPTPMNIDADLGLVELNVKLREKTGGPMMAWASTFAPYAGTKLGIYCRKYGHFESLDDNEVNDSFFDRSVLRHPKKWVGLDLENRKEDPDVWLSDTEQEEYREQNAALRMVFNFVCSMPDGHILARSFLDNGDYSFKALSNLTIDHLFSRVGKSNVASEALKRQPKIVKKIIEDPVLRSASVPAMYFAALPKGDLALERYKKYGASRGYNDKVISTATRHHFYDELLYKTESPQHKERQEEAQERYVPKI